MKSKLVQARAAGAATQPAFSRKLLATGIAAALTSTTGAAVHAQDDEAVLEEVVVVGYRKSLIDSISTKRDSTLIVEAISAEDIGKLPDQSIADSIARLPGIAAQRLDGRASSITVRGLGEDFSATTINGREQVSIGDNRGVEFDLYPSEIVSGLVVYKTPNASLSSQGIAGVIDLRTARPLDYDERVVKFSVFGELNDIGSLNPDGEDTGARITGSYLDQSSDGRFGVAVVANTTTSPNNEERWNAWGYPTNDSGDMVLGGAKPFVRSSELERDSFTGVLQFEPNDRLSIIADAMYIDFSDEKILRGIEIPGQWGGPGPVVVNATTDGLVTDGVFDGRSGVIRNDYEVREAELKAWGINLSYQLTDNWTLTLDAAHSEVERQVWSLESYATASGRKGDGPEPLASIRFNQDDLQGVRFTSDVDYTDFDLARLGAAQGWGSDVVGDNAQDGFINIPSADDELDSFRLDLERGFDSGVVSKVQFGAYYSDRTKSKEDTGRYLTLPQSPATVPVPAQYRVGDVDLGFIGIPGVIAYDSFGFWQDGNYNETDDPSVGRFTNDWSVTEEVWMVYAMADLDLQVLGKDATLNIGGQYIDTDQSSDGFGLGTLEGRTQVLPTSNGDSYGEFLPSISFNLNLSDDAILRLAASRTLSRSRMDRMNAGGSYGFDEVAFVAGLPPFTFNGGNPELRPNMADQFDISYEYYFREDGYIALAAYYKDLQNWQLQQDMPFDIADFVDTSLLPAGLDTRGVATLWSDSDGGEVRGFEVATAIPFGYFNDALEGLGMFASVSFVDSSVEEPNGNEISVPGLSDSIVNVTAYYERGGFEARVSMRDREDFLGERFGLSFTREYRDVVGATIWDAQVGYSFANSGIAYLDGLTVTFQALNMTDEPYETRQDDLTIDYQEFGATYMLGVSYEF